MTQEVSELLKKALALPAEARAALAGSLLESLEDTMDAAAEEEWNQEIARRIAELGSGKVSLFLGEKRDGKSPPSSMAAKPLEIHPSALAELKSALSWYLERNETAADKFVAELDRAIELPVATPRR